jgi:transposase
VGCGASGAGLQPTEHRPGPSPSGHHSKKEAFRAQEREREAVIEERAEFLEWLKTVDLERLWVLDEAASHIAMTPIYGRSRRGQRLSESVPRNRGTVTTLFGALNLRGMTALMTILGGTSGPVFVMYIERMLCPLLQPGDIVILDNLAAHKVNAVRELVEARGASLKFLPPYSPDLSPIEEAWSKVKHIMRALKPRNAAQLDEAFLRGANSITARDAAAYFEHCGYKAQPS